MPKNEALLSSEMKATAEAIRHVRLRLSAMIAQTGVPETFSAADVTMVLVRGPDVATALENLTKELP